MDRRDIERLRALPIEATAERLGLTVKKHLCCCCFHSDARPSMRLYNDSGRFVCYACGAKGDVIDLAMQVLGMTFAGACEWLANATNTIMMTKTETESKTKTKTSTFDAAKYQRFFEHPWLSDKARHFLFEERHLHPAVIRYCRLNSYGDWLQIPYYSREGLLIGVQRRYMGCDPEQPRFKLMYVEPCQLYNLQVLTRLKPGDDLYVAEGPSDVWSLLSSGRKAIGVTSAHSLKASDRQIFEDIKPLGITLHCFPDQDQAGRTFANNLQNLANALGMRLILHELPEGCKDFSDYYINCYPLTRDLQVKVIGY